jgi:hypothetical protein
MSIPAVKITFTAGAAATGHDITHFLTVKDVFFFNVHKS